jgi:hypothetical protein
MGSEDPHNLTPATAIHQGNAQSVRPVELHARPRVKAAQFD